MPILYDFLTSYEEIEKGLERTGITLGKLVK